MDALLQAVSPSQLQQESVDFPQLAHKMQQQLHRFQWVI